MTAAPDLALTNADVHTLTEPDRTAEAVAIEDGTIAAVGTAAGVGAGAAAETVDLGGRTVLPGFVDANFYSETLGQYLLGADLRGAAGPEECVERLRRAEPNGDGWIVGRGFDESTWPGGRYLDREDMNRASEERPVVALREDGHVAAVNDAMLDERLDALPDEHVETRGGRPTGVLFEDAAVALAKETEPGPEEAVDLARSIQAYAHERGVTGVHDMVRDSHLPRAYRTLDLAGELRLRVRINYWYDYLDAAAGLGLRTNHGSAFVRTGAIKLTVDGSLGGRTAKLSEPYADGEGTGEWTMEPDEIREAVRRIDGEGFQICTHAIGDEAVDAVLSAYAEEASDAGAARHRIEHAELTDGRNVERFADLGAVASVQPNFLKWAGPDGLYEDRLGSERREASNPYAAFREAGVPLAFGSDVMPLDPLFGVDRTVNAPVESQRLSVTEALRAYTRGSAYAGFDEGRLGTVEEGKLADLVVLDRSPWEHRESIGDIGVAMTVVDGDVVYDGR